MIPVPRMALSARLALLFAAVTTVVFTVAGFHLYHSLNVHLQRHEDIALLGTLEMVRHQLARRGTIEAVHDVINLLNATYGQSRIILTVRDRNGELLAASTRGAEALPMDQPVALGAAADLSDIRDWYEGSSRRGRIVVAWEPMKNPRVRSVVLAVGRETSTSAILLDEHGREVLLTLISGVLATALLGYAVSRRALRPVQRLAQMAGNITSSNLNDRLHPEDAPRELQELVAAFNLMLERLQDSFRRLDRFSSDIAHDLQTPLSNLMSGTEVALTRTRSVEEYEAVLVSNIEEFQRLSRMIKDLLFLAKADDPDTVIERKPVDLRHELEKVVEYYDTLREEGRPPISVQGDGFALGDQILIQRAIQNLVSNAVRHADGGRVGASISSPEAGFVDVAITDNGPGIAPEHQPYVFDRFYRADPSRSHSAEGSGLGLAIVKSVSELHGGAVLLASTPGVRTTFILRLPSSGPAQTTEP